MLFDAIAIASHLTKGQVTHSRSELRFCLRFWKGYIGWVYAPVFIASPLRLYLAVSEGLPHMASTLPIISSHICHIGVSSMIKQGPYTLPKCFFSCLQSRPYLATR